MTVGDSEIANAYLLPLRKRSLLLRLLIWLAESFAFIAVLAMLAFALLSWRLSAGPVAFEGLNSLVLEIMSRQFPEGHEVSAEQTQIIKQNQGLSLVVDHIRVRDQAGAEVLAIPQAVLAFDGSSLLRLDPKPVMLEFVGLSLTLNINTDGAVSFDVTSPAPIEDGHDQSSRNEASVLAPGELAPLRLASFVDALFAQNSHLSILQRARLRDGHLLIDDRRNARKLVYTNAAFNLLRVPGHAIDLSVTAEGSSGRWTLSGSLSGEPDKTRKMMIRAENLAISELLGLATKGVLPVTTDMPLSFDTSLTIEPDGSVSKLDGQITGGKATVVFDMAGADPIIVTSLAGRFSLSETGRHIVFSDLSLQGRAMQWQGQGQLTLPEGPSEPWRFSFTGRDSLLALESLDKHPIAITSWVLSGQITQGFRGLSVDQLQLDGPRAMIGLAGRFGQFPDFAGVDYMVHGQQLQVRDALAFWPNFAVPDTRSYLIRRLEGGQLEQLDFTMKMNHAELVAAFAEQPIPEESISLKAKLSGAILQPGDGLPLLRDLSGQVHVTGTAVKVGIDQGQIMVSDKRLSMTEGAYNVDDTRLRPTMARINFKTKGAASTVIDALQMPALRGLTPPKLTSDQVKGQADLAVSIVMPIDGDPGFSDIKAEAQGRFSQFSVDRVFGKEKLEGGVLAIAYGADGLSLKGDAKIAGAASHIVYQQGHRDKEPTIQLTMQIDEAVRQRQGIKWGSQLQGPVAAKVLISPNVAKAGAQVELDLTKATINGLLPGWVKPSGRSAKMTFRMITANDDSSQLRDVLLDGGPSVSLRGEVDLSPDGQITQAQFPHVRLSANDDMRVEMERVASLLKIQIRAASLDARPFLKQEFSASSSGQSGQSDLEIDLKAGSLTGYSGQIMQNADLRLVNRGGDIRDFRLSGRFGSKSVAGQMGRSEAGSPALLIESADAGDFLRFLDLYRRMQGGRIVLQVATSGEPKNGLIIISDFALKDDPALAGALKAQPLPTNLTGAEANSVSFTKLRAQYTLGGGKFIVQDAVMWGATMGGTLEGTLDYATDRADMTGTFVPLYGLNNMLTQIPVVGPLLMGGSNAGIFAINFRISGSVASPTVTINPLSAVAPGIFRKLFLFGVGKSSDNDHRGSDTPTKPPTGDNPPAKNQ